MSETASEGNSRFSWDFLSLLAKKDNKSKRPAPERSLSRHREKKNLLEVLSIHYVGTHGSRMLCSPKTHHLFIQTVWYLFRNSFAIFCSLWSTKNCNLFQTLPCRLSHFACFMGKENKTHTWLWRELYHQITEICPSLRFSPPFFREKNISHSFDLHSEKITTCEISFPRRALNSNDALFSMPSHTWRCCEEKECY